MCFDKAGKVRVLDEEKYEQTKQLQEQTAAFSNSKSPAPTRGSWPGLAPRECNGSLLFGRSDVSQ